MSKTTYISEMGL